MTAAEFVPQGGLGLVLSRAVFVAALLGLDGALVFRVLVMPAVAALSTDGMLRRAEGALGRFAWTMLVSSAAALALWTVLQAAEIAGAARLGDVVGALGPVLGGTQFGHVVLLQAAALAGTALCLRLSRPLCAALAASGDVVAQAAHGHGMAMGGPGGALFWVDGAHLLAAAGWIGGLVPLLLVVRFAPNRAAALAARGFSPIGKWCVGVLAGSGLIQGWVLTGGLRPLFGTAYGTVVLVKIACFAVLLALAVLNRYRLAPRLLGDRPARARRRLIGSIASQTGAGLLAVAAAAVLSGLTPGMDMDRGG